MSHRKKKRGKPPKPLKSAAGQPAGKPCATCTAQKPPPTPPCDFDAVKIKCSHCGSDKRSIADVTFKHDPVNGKRSSNQVPPSNPRQPRVTDRFEVLAPDEVTVELSGGPGFGADHPLILVSPPEFIGPPTPHRGKTHKFKVDIDRAWFPRAIENTRRLGFVAGLRQFFTPPAAVYRFEAIACGTRPPSQPHRWGRFAHAIAVYPKDTFKISLSLPSLKKREWGRSGYVEGKVTGGTQSSGTSSGLLRTAESTKTETRETANSVLIRQTDVAADRQGGATQTQSLATLRGRDYHRNDIKASDAPDHQALAVAKSFTFVHDGKDVTHTFKPAEFIEVIAQLRQQVMDLYDFFKGLAAKSPKIGWSLAMEVEVCSGSLEYEWGYKERLKDHTVYRWYKVNVSITVISAKVELAFGLELLKAKAQVYGSLSGDLKISGEREANPDGTGPAATITAAPSIGGEIGVRGALGDWIEVVGKITGGFEGSTSIELAPFAWKAKLELSAGKGTFNIKSKFWFDTKKEAELWAKRTLWEKTLIG
jgi:hypothetical protein